MIKIKDECVGCPPEMGCLGSGCPNRNVVRYYCDKCKNEVDEGELLHYDGEHWCADCIIESLEIVKADD